MNIGFRKSVIIRGVDVPRRRFTGWAAVYFLLYVGLPVLGFGLALDTVLYFLFAHLFDACYAVLCLFR
ncbi:MAG: hypothetical protein V3R85_08930 [Alphaproteobacteria bacterium]